MNLKAIIPVLAVILAIPYALIKNADTLPSLQIVLPPIPIETNAEQMKAFAEHLAGAIRFKTVSSAAFAEDHLGPQSGEQMLQLHAFLEKSYPFTHKTLSREVVSTYSLLYQWTGSDPLLKPLLLMAHMDVVPVDPHSEAEWTHHPWEGVISGGFIWGRGSFDDKFCVIALLETVEALIKDGFMPERSLYIAFGHDEEVGGDFGAVRIAALLKERGVELEFVLDEGSGITPDALYPLFKKPVAVISLSEKGSTHVEVSVETAGGHSMNPPLNGTAITVLTAALMKLDQNPMARVLTDPFLAMLEYLTPEVDSKLVKVILANLWLTRPLVEAAAASRQVMAPYVRTSMVATMIKGGVAPNVLPQRVTAVVNCRLLPGQSAEDLLRYMRGVVNDARVKIGFLKGQKSEASPVSPTNSTAFRMLQKVTMEVFGPEVVVAPFFSGGGTDSRHYSTVTSNIYRFLPFKAPMGELARMHNTDERLSLDVIPQALAFYKRIISTYPLVQT